MGLCLAVRKLSSSPKNVLYFIRTSTLLLQCCPKELKKSFLPRRLLSSHTSYQWTIPLPHSSFKRIFFSMSISLPISLQRPAGLRFSLDPLNILWQGGHAVARPDGEAGTIELPRSEPRSRRPAWSSAAQQTQRSGRRIH